MTCEVFCWRPGFFRRAADTVLHFDIDLVAQDTTASAVVMESRAGYCRNMDFDLDSDLDFDLDYYRILTGF